MFGRLGVARSGAGELDRVHLADTVGGTIPLLGLLGAQLGQVVQSTQDSAMSLLGEVQAVDAATGELVEEAGHLAELTRRQAAEMADIAQASRGTGEAIEKLLAYVERRDQAVVDLVTEVRGLSDQLAAIQKISRATTTLALNAKIEASRAGAQGAGFQVVADEVRELSRQSDTVAQQIGTRIEQLAERLARAMADHADDAAVSADAGCDQALTERVRHVATEQSDLIGRLEQFTGEVTDTAHELVASSSTVHGLTTTMMAGCQTQDVERQAIEHVVGSLDQVGSELASIADVLAGRAGLDGIAAVEAALDRIKAGYVMHAQRRVHAEALGGAAIAGDGPQIELF